MSHWSFLKLDVFASASPKGCQSCQLSTGTVTALSLQAIVLMIFFMFGTYSASI
jgi:hypothetical protein